MIVGDQVFWLSRTYHITVEQPVEGETGEGIIEEDGETTTERSERAF